MTHPLRPDVTAARHGRPPRIRAHVVDLVLVALLVLIYLFVLSRGAWW